MKTAYLWVVDWSWARKADDIHEGYRGQVTADLFFTSREKFLELYTSTDALQMQLVPVQVPDDFTDWDYIPDNY